MAGLFIELKRRNVFKVGAAYLIVAWLILQVAATAFPALHLPDWTVTFVTLLLLLGFPIALVLAWAFDLTPDGLRRTSNTSSTAAKSSGRTIDFVIIGLLLVAVGFLTLDKFVLDRTGREQVAGTDEKSIAVLPFLSMSSDPDQEFFADGITEEILNTLAAIDGLKVAGRTSSFQFKGANEDLREIGRMLGVSTLLEGSVRKADDEVRITAQLVGSDTGFHLWSQTFDRRYADVFAIQTEIADAVGAALQVQLGMNVEQSVARRSTENLEAYSLYLQAMQLSQEQDFGSLRKALEMSRRVMEMDPDFLPGYVAYGMSATWLLSWGVALSEPSLSEVEHLMRQTLARDPEFAQAWGVLAASHIYRFQWEQAEAAFNEATRLDPNLVSAIDEWAYALFMLRGRPADAIPLLERVISVEPLSLYTRISYAQALAALGRWEEAEAEFRRLLELDPKYGLTYYYVGSTYNLRLGRLADAVPWYQKAMELDPETLHIPAEIAQALHDMGAVEDAKEAVLQIDPVGHDSYTSSSRYTLARLSGEQATADAIKEYLATNLEQMVEGLGFVEALEWLRSLQAEDPDRALSVYRRIQPELFDNPPKVGTWNHGTALSLAFLHLQQGNKNSAQELARAVLQVMDTTIDRYSYATSPAVAWLILGEEDRAIEALDRTFRIEGNRFAWGYLETDAIYEPIRQRPEFQALLDYIRADMAEQLEQLRIWEASKDHPLSLDFGV